MKFTSDSRDNLSGYSSVGYDAVVTAISEADGEKAKAKVVYTAEKYLANAAVILPLYEINYYQAHAKNISGIIYNRTGDVLYFKNTLEK